MSIETSDNNQAVMLDNQLRALRDQRSRVRPWVAFLTGILFLILGALILHGMFGILLIVLGVVALLTCAVALAKRSELDRRIEELQKQIEAS